MPPPRLKSVIRVESVPSPVLDSGGLGLDRAGRGQGSGMAGCSA